MCNGSVLGIVRILLNKLLRDPKLYIVLVMLAAILDEYTGAARQVVSQYQLHVNGWGSFACLTSYSFVMLWIVAGYLILVADVPFANSLSLFEGVRVAPWQSLLARVFYLFILSVCYTLAAFILACLIQFASLARPFQWDKALYTMSRGQSVGDVFLRIPSSIVAAYSPFAAWCAASGLLAAALTLLGLMMLCISLYLEKRAAVCTVSLWASLDFAIGYMLLDEKLYFASPLSWARLEMLELSRYYTDYPSQPYCVTMLAGLTAFLAALCILFTLNRARFAKKFSMEGEIP